MSQLPGLIPETAVRPRIGIIVACGVCALLLILGKSMSQGMSADEHVFLSSASLWGHSGLMPYRDFHYNHLPTLLLIYGVMFKATDHLLLATRLFSTLCATGVVTIIFGLALVRFQKVGLKRPVTYAVLVAALMMCNSLFTLTTGLAWNHDFPTLLTLLAFLILLAGLERNRSAAWMLGSGFVL